MGLYPGGGRLLSPVSDTPRRQEAETEETHFYVLLCLAASKDQRESPNLSQFTRKYAPFSPYRFFRDVDTNHL